MKTCTKCGVEKSLDDFPPRKESKDGRRNQCRGCRRDAMSKWRDKNPGYVTRNVQKWRENNRDKQVAWQTEYHRRVRASRKVYMRKYYRENRDARRAYNRGYGELRRARRAELAHEYVTVRQVALRDGAHCWLCGDELSDFDPSHMDHLIPIAADDGLLAAWGVENPGTVAANMALACPECNMSKSNKILPCAIARYLRNLEPIEAAA